MMEMSECVRSLLENDPELMDGAVDVLLKIADNILKEPKNEKFRAVNLSSGQVERRLLPAIGALEVLFLMGFEEAGDKLVLPQDDPLDNLQIYREQLICLKTENKGASKGGPLAPVAAVIPALTASESEMKSRLLSELERVLEYESPSLQEKARQVLPVQELHDQARKKLAVINKDISENEKPLDFQDCVLTELLEWFKTKFFKWFDAPTCPKCQKKMSASGNLPPTEDDIKWGGRRVEGYSCQSCGTADRFVRYNHPAKLLETREGRCGEWANCFTLLCRTLGMDVRYILDYTDHVWSEVYSQSQGRWLHTDCCENKMDCPKLYEQGWGKKLTYIFAFSKDEVVDVTWRYTDNPKEVLKRRNKCREAWLVSTLMQINKKWQESFSQPRKSFLETRLVAEIAQSLASNQAIKESEMEGRSSGSLAWRLSRGETQSLPASSYTFKVSPKEDEKKEFLVKYSSASDEYVRVNEEKGNLNGWQSGVKTAKDIFRKDEADWKMVYLARREGTTVGELSWEVDWSHTQLKAKSVLVVFQHATFENGSVEWQLCTGDKCVSGNKDGVLELTSDILQGTTKKLEVSAVLSKGKGSNSWQAAQLFRQPSTSTDQFPFYIHIRFE